MDTVDIRALPLKQMAFILKLHDSPKKRAYAKSKSEGATAKQLKEKGWIVPAGKDERRIRWELIKEFTSTEIALMRELVKEK